MFLLPRSLLLIGAGVLGVSYLIGTGQAGSGFGGPEPCTFRVTADVLNVRSGPSSVNARVGELRQGAEVAATPNVVGGFRDLGDARWAATEFLATAPDSTCGP
ncbi:SH3 domain-containing protein [Saccharopolyspora sp. NPDC000995]